MDFTSHVTLGRTGLSVSRIGLASSFGVPAKCVEAAYQDHGINFFYWGSIRRSRFADGLRNLAKANREKLVIMLQSYDRTGFLMPIFLERGLRELKMDSVDVLLLGWHNHTLSDRVMEAALKLKAEGKVRFLAISGHERTFLGEQAQRSDNPFDLLMFRYNAAHRGAERDIFPFLPEKNRPGMMAYTATRWGNLLNPSKMPKDERPLTASECYRFALSSPFVDLVMSGPKDEAQFGQMLPALTGGPLSEAELARVRRIGDHVHG